MSIKRNDDLVPDLTAERIAALMWRKRLTVSSLATAIGKGRASMSTKINGHARWYLDELIAVSTVLDTSVGYLLGETDDDTPPSRLRGHEKAPVADTTGADQWARRGSNPRPAD
jgi:hypothetical protein